MRVTSSKPRGQKMFKCVTFKHKTCKTKVKRPFWIQPVDGGWFCLEKGQWEKEYNCKGNMSSAYYSMSCSGYHDVYSLKAVKKLINRWDVPKGTKFMASLPFNGHDFYITK